MLPAPSLPPPKKEVMFSFWSVCLFVFLFVCPSDNWKSCKRILAKFLGGLEQEHGPGTNESNFGDDPDHRADLGVRNPKSGFSELSKKLPMDFDEILWRAGVWPRDQLITFWWRSASLSGTIRIREELPRCQHTQNRCPQCSPSAELCWRSAEVCALWVLLVCFFVCWLVHICSLATLVVISRKVLNIRFSWNLAHMFQMTVLTLWDVKVRGQNRQTVLKIFQLHCESKKHATILLSISSPNTDRF